MSLDVVGLYPHIPHVEGLEAIRQALDKRETHEVPTSLIVDLVELVLKNNKISSSMVITIYRHWGRRLVLKWRLPMRICLWIDWKDD